MPTSVSVIILNHNGQQYLRRCLDALFLQSYREFEIIFIDNASTDGSIAFLQQSYRHAIRRKRLRIIRNMQNQGFAQGNNTGWRAARGELVVLLNNDTRPHRDWLQHLVKSMRQHPQIMACGSAYYDTGRKSEWEELFLKRSVGLTMNLSGEAVMCARETLGDPALIRAFFVSGNGVMLRKAQFERPFFAPYFAYAEDTYLGWLIQIRGGEVAYHLGARMEHLGGGTKRVSSSAFRDELLFHGSKNQLMNPLLFYRWWTLVRVAPLLALTQLGHLIDNPRKFLIKCRAHWWVLTHLPTVLRERKRVQRMRRRGDRAVVSRMSSVFFDPAYARSHYNQTYQRAILALNALSRWYCQILLLPARDNATLAHGRRAGSVRSRQANTRTGARSRRRAR